MARILSEATQDTAVLWWRHEQAKEAGYTELEAQEIAAALYIDLHEAVELVRSGCPHALAVRILL